MATLQRATELNTLYIRVKITEFDPQRGYLEGVNQLNQPYRINWYNELAIITAPQVGEEWIISRLDNTWQLLWRVPTPENAEENKFLLPGDRRIVASNRLHIKAREVLVNGRTLQNRTPIYNEVPFGDLDGENTLYSTYFLFMTGTLRVYFNGLRDRRFTEIGNQLFELDFTPEASDTLIVDYDYLQV